MLEEQAMAEAANKETEKALRALERAMRTVHQSTVDSPKLFPHGITKIIVKVEATKLEIEVSGPDAAAAAAAASQVVSDELRTSLASFATLWANHPYPADPCSVQFEHQCAIRMTVAFETSGIPTASFDRMFPNRRCWSTGHKPGHILSAEEFARWVDTEKLFGRTSKRKNVTSANYVGKTGLVAFLNMPSSSGGTIDHIDLWNRNVLKAGEDTYFAAAEEVWFWDIS
jgi:hypothetical protein